MTVREFKVRYGDNTYEYRDGQAYPRTFRDDLHRNMGIKVQYGDDKVVTVSPANPDAAYHFVVDGIHHGIAPDETITLIDDTSHEEQE